MDIKHDVMGVSQCFELPTCFSRVFTNLLCNINEDVNYPTVIRPTIFFHTPLTTGAELGLDCHQTVLWCVGVCKSRLRPGRGT